MSSEPDPGLLPPSAGNLAFVEELYRRWMEEPAAVAPEWQRYFARWPRTPRSAPPDGNREGPARPRPRTPAPAAGRAYPGGPDDVALEWKVDRLATAYREHGHLQAKLDPLGLERLDHVHLRLEDFGLSEADLDRLLPGGGGDATLRGLVARLEETYCRTLGVETGHLHDAEFRRWLQERMERTRNHIGLDAGAERRLLEMVTRAELLEQFLAARFKLAAQLGHESDGFRGENLREFCVDGAVDFHAAGKFLAHSWHSGLRFSGKKGAILWP